MNTSQQDSPRANRHGSKCPAWCDIDHEHVNVHTGRVIDMHQSAPTSPGGVYPRVILTQYSSEHDTTPAEVQVSGILMPGFVFTSPEMAGDLADLIQSLAVCPPRRLRALAQEIRAAAQIARDAE